MSFMFIKFLTLDSKNVFKNNYHDEIECSRSSLVQMVAQYQHPVQIDENFWVLKLTRTEETYCMC